LAGSVIGGWGFRFVKIKGQKGGKFGKYLKIFRTIKKCQSFDISYAASLGHEDSSLFTS